MRICTLGTKFLLMSIVQESNVDSGHILVETSKIETRGGYFSYLIARLKMYSPYYRLLYIDILQIIKFKHHFYLFTKLAKSSLCKYQNLLKHTNCFDILSHYFIFILFI